MKLLKTTRNATKQTIPSNPAEGAAIGTFSWIVADNKTLPIPTNVAHPFYQLQTVALGMFGNDQIPGLGSDTSVSLRIDKNFLAWLQQGSHGVAGDAKTQPAPQNP